MKRKNHERVNPTVVRTGTTNTQNEIQAYEFENASETFLGGFKCSSKKTIRAALREWARVEEGSEDSIVKFLARMSKETLTGEILEPFNNDQMPF